MQRRHLLTAAAAAAVTASLPSAGAIAAGASVATDADRSGGPGGSGFDPRPGAWREYEITTRLELVAPSRGARAWVPLPAVAEPAWVRHRGDEWSSNAARVQLASDGVHHARMVFAQWPAGTEQAVLTVTSRIATRDRAVDPGRDTGVPALDPATKRFYTAPTALIRTDGIVRDTARRIVAGARTDEDRARALYDWICERTHRDPKTRGCGLGDVTAMLESGNLGGKCADLNALFVGLARAAGLPARDVYGLRVAPSRFGYRSLGASSANVTRAQHCRAEVWLAGRGWVPVDPADVRKVVLEEPPGTLTLADAKVRDARRALFGAWEMNWMPYNTAHDLVLPGAIGPALPFLMYPQAETPDGRFDELDPDNFKYSITARTVTG